MLTDRARTRRHVQLNPEAWKLGFAAGLVSAETPDVQPEGVDALAYWAGVIEGQAKRVENNREAFLQRAKQKAHLKRLAETEGPTNDHP